MQLIYIGQFSVLNPELGVPSSSVGRVSDSRSTCHVFETRSGHLVVGSDLT